MKTRITQFIPALCALLIIGFRYFGLWCTDIGHVCYGTWLDSIFLGAINPLDSFARYFLLAALVLIFVSRPIFNSWLKFAAWAIPLAIIFIATTPVNFTGIGPDFFPFYRDDAARFMGEVVSVGSIIVISIYAFCMKKGDPEEMRNAAKECAALAGALMGFLCVAVSASMVLFNIGSFGALILLIFLSVLIGIYGIFRIPSIIIEKKKNLVPLGWRMTLSAVLLGINIAALAAGSILIRAT